MSCDGRFVEVTKRLRSARLCLTVSADESKITKVTLFVPALRCHLSGNYTVVLHCTFDYHWYDIPFSHPNVSYTYQSFMYPYVEFDISLQSRIRSFLDEQFQDFKRKVPFFVSDFIKGGKVSCRGFYISSVKVERRPIPKGNNADLRLFTIFNINYSYSVDFNFIRYPRFNSKLVLPYLRMWGEHVHGLVQEAVNTYVTDESFLRKLGREILLSAGEIGYRNVATYTVTSTDTPYTVTTSNTVPTYYTVPGTGSLGYRGTFDPNPAVVWRDATVTVRNPKVIRCGGKVSVTFDTPYKTYMEDYTFTSPLLLPFKLRRKIDDVRVKGKVVGGFHKVDDELVSRTLRLATILHDVPLHFKEMLSNFGDKVVVLLLFEKPTNG